MGAKIGLSNENYPPIQVLGSNRLKGLQYELPVASAQLKSAIILAGLFAEGTTHLTGKIHSRDHTERLLPHFGIQLETSHREISLIGGQTLSAASIRVPGDLSSAAFWIAAAAIVPNSHLELENVSLNPSRTGLLEVLKRMGVRIQLEMTETQPEPVGKLKVTSAPLCGTTIESHEIPSLIDELPLIAILATFAEGPTLVRGAEELRVKETDRIEAVAINLRAMGAEIETTPDGFLIMGPQPLRGSKVRSFDDHRIAMAFSIAALRAQGPTEILESDCVGISYPNFYRTLEELVT
jgi:3-phosphoshikimate 1-carboxyvinyltransferase